MLVVRDALSRGAQARFRVSGGSMWPFIRNGAIVLVAPYGDASVCRGDVVLARRADGSYLLHRVARVADEGALLLGDAQQRPEGPFSASQLLGRVVSVEHGDRAVLLTHRRWRAAGLLWLALRPCRGTLLLLARGARRVWKRPEGAGHEFDLLLCCARVQLGPEAARRAWELLALPVDWERLTELADQHGLVPLLSRGLQSAAPQKVPEAIRERLRGGHHANALRSLGLFREAIRLLSALEAEGIPALPHKGPVVADLIYGDVALREISDLDILVDPSDFGRAEAVLAAHGYGREEAVELSRARMRALLTFGQHMRFRREDGRATVELHWRPAGFAFAPGLGRLALWERTRTVCFGGREVRLPATEDLLLLLCLHGYKHLFSSLKWVCDIAELTRTPFPLDWGLVMGEANRLRCRPALSVGCLLAHELFGAAVPPDLLVQARADRAGARIAAAVGRRLRESRPPRSRRVSYLRDLCLHVRAVDGLRNRLRFCLSWAVPDSARAIARLPLPGLLLSAYWAAAPAAFLQRRGAAARAKLQCAVSRLRRCRVRLLAHR